ncbi:hypothetical protein ATCC90586_005529 [Pythium insidiosum]|nr:hypothetical protein ATCC90586_005529 [Pythium insidiosum]
MKDSAERCHQQKTSDGDMILTTLASDDGRTASDPQRDVNRPRAVAFPAPQHVKMAVLGGFIHRERRAALAAVLVKKLENREVATVVGIARTGAVALCISRLLTYAYATPPSVTSTMPMAFCVPAIAARFGAKTHGQIIVTPSATDLDAITKLIEGGQVKTFVDTVFEFGQVAEAIQRQQQRRSVGKLVIKVADE